jgi:hypothetical protein
VADFNFVMTPVSPTTIVLDDLRARLRQELHDEDSGTYRWLDATLDRHIERAVRELSQVWPRERKSTLVTTPGSRDLDFASQQQSLVRIEAVEWPAGRYPAVYVQWSLYQDTLSLLTEEAPGGAEDVAVYWGSLHEVDASQSTLPSVAEDAVVTGAAAYAALEWSNFATNRANVAGTNAPNDYRDWGESQLRRFREQLSEFGRRARLRVSGLFSPGRGSSRNVVSWDA